MLLALYSWLGTVSARCVSPTELVVGRALQEGAPTNSDSGIVHHPISFNMDHPFTKTTGDPMSAFCF
jgi:hypothetical protein